MVRTLNASYNAQPYGLGNVNTTYPVSAFITDLVYMKGSNVAVDIKHITVSDKRTFVIMLLSSTRFWQSLGVKCTELEGNYGHTTSFNADAVKDAIRQVLSSEG